MKDHEKGNMVTIESSTNVYLKFDVSLWSIYKSIYILDNYKELLKI
jgi:hypothetical protein